MDKRRRRATPSCRSKDLYTSPKAGAQVRAGSNTFRWNPHCLPSMVDVYLYASRHQGIQLPLHAWLGVPASKGSLDVTIMPQWWNISENVPINVQFVPSGQQPWDSRLPISPTWTVRVNQKSESSGANAMSMDQSDHVTQLNSTQGLSSGALAGAVVGPILGVLVLILAVFFWHRRQKEMSSEKQAVETQRWQQYDPSEKPDMQYGGSYDDSGMYDTTADVTEPYADVLVSEPVEPYVISEEVYPVAEKTDTPPESMSLRSDTSSVKPDPPPKSRQSRAKSLSRRQDVHYHDWRSRENSIKGSFPESREQIEAQHRLPSRRLSMLEGSLSSSEPNSTRTRRRAPHKATESMRIPARYLEEDNRTEVSSEDTPQRTQAGALEERSQRVAAYLAQLPTADKPSIQETDAPVARSASYNGSRSASRISRAESAGDVFCDAGAF